MKTRPHPAREFPRDSNPAFFPAFRLSGPDLVTGLRPLCGLAVWAALLLENSLLAFAFLLLGGLTDAVDGWWARRRPLSPHGAAWDGLADRLFFYLIALGLWQTARLPEGAFLFLLAWPLAEFGAAHVIRRRTSRPYLDLEHLPAAKWFGANACCLGAVLILNIAPYVWVFGFLQLLLLGWLVLSYHHHTSAPPADGGVLPAHHSNSSA